jgi:hypothetical protein
LKNFKPFLFFSVRRGLLPRLVSLSSLSPSLLQHQHQQQKEKSLTKRTATRRRVCTPAPASGPYLPSKP